MHSVKSIINNAIESRGQGKSILIINDNETEYLKGFADLHQHRFFILEKQGSPSWVIPHNFTRLRSLTHLNELDLIICCNRGETFDEAKKISLHQHVPMVVIDFCGASSIIPHPFASSLLDKEPASYIRKNGDVHVSVHESIENSWLPTSNYLSITIPPKIFPEGRRRKDESGKYNIAIEPFPRQYLQSLNIQVPPNAVLTTDLSSADIFINLWGHVSCTTLKAMTLGIPVVCMKTEDEHVKYLSENQCCIIVNQIQDIKGLGFVEEILELHKKHDMKDKALAEVLYSKDFASDWNSIIDYSTNKCYIRN